VMAIIVLAFVAALAAVVYRIVSALTQPDSLPAPDLLSRPLKPRRGVR
jgi:hypothetical protein